MNPERENKVFGWLADRLQYGASVLYTCSYICLALSYLSRERSSRAIRQPPTVMQYYQRLIEFYDPPDVLEAAKRLDKLIQLGVNPEHAFRMIISG